MSQNAFKISSIIEEIEIIMHSEENSGCGELNFELYGPTHELSFLSLNRNINKLVLSPQLSDEIGEYEGSSFLEFFYSEFPSITYKIPITSIIHSQDECIIKKVFFDPNHIEVEYVLGDSDFEVSLPPI